MTRPLPDPFRPVTLDDDLPVEPPPARLSCSLTVWPEGAAAKALTDRILHDLGAVGRVAHARTTMDGAATTTLFTLKPPGH